MKVRTKIVGSFAALFACLLAVQAVSYAITKRSVYYMEGIQDEVNELRLVLEARNLFLEENLALSNYLLFPREFYAQRLESASSAFSGKLAELDAQLRECGVPEQVEGLDGAKRLYGSYLEKSYAFMAGVSDDGVFADRVGLDSLRALEQDLLAGLVEVQRDTTRLMKQKRERLRFLLKVNKVMSFLRPIAEVETGLHADSVRLEGDMELSLLVHARAVAARRYLLTGQGEYAERSRGLGRELGRRLDWLSRQGRVGPSSKVYDEMREFSNSLSPAFEAAALRLGAGDPVGARAAFLGGFVQEELLDDAVEGMLAGDAVRIDAAYAALAPVMEYALLFNRQLHALLALVGLMTVAAGLFLASRILRPVLGLTAAAQRIAGGDLTGRVEVKSADEIGEMAAAFNDMADELQKAQAELSAAYGKYKSIVENVGAGVALVGPRMELVGSNSLFKKWFPAVGESGWAACFWYRSADETLKSFVYGRNYDTAFEIYGGGARTMTYRVLTSPVKDDAGGVIGAVQIYEDITRQIEADRERARLMAELERSNRELQDFAYIASHDLQSPLRKVVSFSQLLEGSLRDRLTSDDLENLGFVVQSARHMQALINDLLEYSRVETRGRPFEPVDLGALLEDVERLSLARLEEMGGKVVANRSMPSVVGDQAQLHRLLQNIVDNALKYHREGVPPRVTVSASSAPGCMVRVEVSDNGIGIPHEHHERIFRMFQRLHGAGRYEGTGIGLAVCQRIVRRHGGDIGVVSEPGRGSTFWFTLPGAVCSLEPGEVREAA